MASPTTPRYCKYFFSARGCNQGNDCKYLHQKMDEVRMELPCTALSLDIETTGCWPGVHKIVAVGVALFQLHPSHQVVELDRRLFQFQVNYPHDFDEITMRDFWHVQGRMDLLEALQNGAKPEEDAIKEFYDYYTEVCHRYPKFFLVTDNPVMDLGFLNLSIATKLGKPPLTYRPVPRASPQPPPPAGVSNEDSGLRLAGHGLELRSAARSPSSGLSEESESDDEELSSTDGGDEEGESDEDGFGESGEEDCGADGDAAGGSNASGGPADQLLLAPVSEIAKRVVQLQTRPAAATATADAGVAGSSGKRLASFYDDYSAPHFAIDLNSFACGLVGLHLPPFRRAGGSRWASPADFLSFHKPFLVCPYRKTHDPVDDASFNCWQFLQCVSILWMNEYAEVHQSASASSARKELDTATATATAAAKNASGAAKPTYSDAEFPTIASANATSDRKKQQQQQRSPRRGRAASTLGAGKDKTSSPSRGSKQPHHQHARHSSSASQALTTSPSSPSSSQQHQHQQQQPTAKANPQVQRRTARSYSDPPLMAELNQSSHAASVIAKAGAFSDATPEGASAAAAAAERTRSRQQQRAASVKVL